MRSHRGADRDRLVVGRRAANRRCTYGDGRAGGLAGLFVLVAMLVVGLTINGIEICGGQPVGPGAQPLRGSRRIPVLFCPPRATGSMAATTSWSDGATAPM